MKLPSLPQMVNRSASGHRRVLAAIANGDPIGTVHDSPGALRGLRICLQTLYRWQCIDGETLTERGRELLAALDARAAAAVK